MYKNLQNFLDEWGVRPPPTTDNKDVVSASLRKGLMGMDILPSFTSLDFEYPTDAVVILADGELADLKYPFDEAAVGEALDNLADALG